MTQIHVGQLRKEVRGERPFGFCCDIGAPRSVIGKKEMNRVFTKLGMHHRRLYPSRNRFRFADTVYDSLGTVTIPLSTPAGIPNIMVSMDVVNADIPALLGMDVMDKESLTPCTISNRLVKRVRHETKEGKELYLDQWHIHLVRSNSNHLYAEMFPPTAVNFTRTQLRKLHRQFFHPSAEKLFNLIKKARPDEATPQTLEEIKDIAKRCDPCQRIQNAPCRFRVSLGAENLRFNERIMIDIMNIDGNNVLHIVDEATRFSAACFLKDNSTQTVWEAIVCCWASIYTGLPNRILTDQGSQFGQRFIDLAKRSDVEVNRTGIEAHSSLGIGERYHGPLRNTFRKLKIEFPNVKKEVALACSVKAMNDTLGPEGLVPSVLVFGEYPQIRTLSEPVQEKSTLQKRATMAEMARKEMSAQMVELKLKRALHHAVPPACERSYEPGDKVLVWREKLYANRIGEWLGPFEIENVDYEKKLAFIRDVEVGPARPFNLTQVKSYFPPTMLANAFMCDLNESMGGFRSPDDGDFFIHATEVIDDSDPRAHDVKMQEAKKAEVRNLLKRGTFKVILKEDIPPDGNVLPGRFVLALKSTLDGKVKYKARYVIGGHRDRMKHLMVHSTATLQPHSIRLLLALSSMFGFPVWTSDIRQAYLQSTEPLGREIYIDKAVPEFELDPGECLMLLKPLYGLCDAGDLWHICLDKHHKNDLGMKPMRIDPALYYLIQDGKLRGLSGSYVDDLIRSGDSEFRKLSRLTQEKFEMTEECTLPSEFTGFIVDRKENGSIVLSQTSYLKKLECLPLDASFAAFRSMRMKLAWLSNTRPDCLFQISQLSQVTESRYEAERSKLVKRLNKAVKYAVDNKVNVIIPKLDLQTAKIVGFSDASFANNHDLSTQLGYILFISDAANNCAPIFFKSYKARRVTRSAMSAEVIAFSDMFDAGISFSMELSVLLGRKVALHLLTDSKSLFDVISKGSRTSEKRTMIDVAAAREAFKDRIISDIGFVRSSSNIADGLTKSMAQAQLRYVVGNGTLEYDVAQWIIRK